MEDDVLGFFAKEVHISCASIPRGCHWFGVKQVGMLSTYLTIECINILVFLAHKVTVDIIIIIIIIMEFIPVNMPTDSFEFGVTNWVSYIIELLHIKYSISTEYYFN